MSRERHRCQSSARNTTDGQLQSDFLRSTRAIAFPWGRRLHALPTRPIRAIRGRLVIRVTLCGPNGPWIKGKVSGRLLAPSADWVTRLPGDALRLRLDARVTIASQAALQMVLDRVGRFSADDKVDDFVTDACETVAMAYHHAAGVYVADEKMKKLGTAAVHLLTIGQRLILRDSSGWQITPEARTFLDWLERGAASANVPVTEPSPPPPQQPPLLLVGVTRWFKTGWKRRSGAPSVG